MASVAATVQNWNANFKQIYADSLKNLVPDSAKLIKMIDMLKKDKAVGDSFEFPVIVSLENGFTYLGTQGLAPNYEDAEAAGVQRGTVKPSELVLRSILSFGAISRSMNEKGAFEKATKLVMGNMLQSMYHRLEIQMIHGQSSTGLGVVESISGNTIKIEDHEWAPGLWNGSKNAKIQIYDTTLATLRGSAKIVSVDYDTKELALDLAPVGVVATDVIFFNGAKDNEFMGLHAIASKSGTLFGINNAAYDLFKGNVVDVGTNFSGGEAVLSFAASEKGIAKAMDKGLGQEAYELLISTRSWNNLLTEQAAKRMYDSSYSSAQIDQGAKAIRFHGLNGQINIHASTLVKEGYAYGFVAKDLARIGSSDVTFEMPGYEGEIFSILPDTHGLQVRCYSDQALVCFRPGATVLFRYIKS